MNQLVLPAVFADVIHLQVICKLLATQIKGCINPTVWACLKVTNTNDPSYHTFHLSIDFEVFGHRLDGSAFLSPIVNSRRYPLIFRDDQSIRLPSPGLLVEVGSFADLPQYSKSTLREIVNTIDDRLLKAQNLK